MRTTLRLRKLEKATKIVEMLQKAYNNAEDARCNLHHFDNFPNQPRFYYTTREELSEKRIHWMNVAQRLEQYYDNTMEGIFETCVYVQ